MNNNRLLTFLAALLYLSCLLLALAGCANESSRAANDMASIANSTYREPPAQIALLLPMSGKYRSQGVAIRNGFFAAYYQSKPGLANPPRVRVYDTAKQSVQQVYAQAVQEGAQFVVGPLVKDNVAMLTRERSLPVPTLALNNLDGVARTRNFYQFALSPIDEAQQAAWRMMREGRRRVVIIAQNDSLDQRIANAFVEQWQSMNGRLIQRLDFAKPQQLGHDIQAMLNVDFAYAQKQALQRLLQQKVRFTPRRRADVDAIFIAARPSNARQIRPLLAYYYAQDLPLYATSQIYAGHPNPRRDRDLDGIMFCDTPWNLTPEQMTPPQLTTIRHHLQTLWPQSFYRFSNLYAFGVDAYDMIPYLSQMDNAKLDGATGALFLKQRQIVTRQLPWARMQQGVAQPIPS